MSNDYDVLLKRYEQLKRRYFSQQSGRQFDDEGQEIPSALSRESIVQQFERMGCEIPLSPTYPFTPVGRSQ